MYILNRKPEWLRVYPTHDPNVDIVEGIIKNLGLNTVCREAHCPNYSECFSRKTATFMILGANCTRRCRFCNVRHGIPQPINPDEPENIGIAIKELGLKYAVITSVTRDDLPDGGAKHFAEVIRAVRKHSPDTAVEVLIPDFRGNIESLEIVGDACPDVISHNMETVEELYSVARSEAEYKRSLEVLRNIKSLGGGKRPSCNHPDPIGSSFRRGEPLPCIRSKSGIMLGLGETKEQVHRLFDDLLEVGCEFLTIGQYLAPSKSHYPVHEYITPEQFEEYGRIAKEKGFAFVASAPLVRSSYRAEEALKSNK